MGNNARYLILGSGSMDADDHHSLLHAKLGPTFGMKFTIGGTARQFQNTGDQASKQPLGNP